VIKVKVSICIYFTINVKFKSCGIRYLSHSALLLVKFSTLAQSAICFGHIFPVLQTTHMHFNALSSTVFSLLFYLLSTFEMCL